MSREIASEGLGRENEKSSPSASLRAAAVWHLFKINLRNYHSATVPSLGFYNFIFLLQCLYPRAPQFISAAQPRWIINGGRERKDDERLRRFFAVSHRAARVWRRLRRRRLRWSDFRAASRSVAKKMYMLAYNFLRDTFANTECLTALPFNGLQKVSPF